MSRIGSYRRLFEEAAFSKSPREGECDRPAVDWSSNDLRRPSSGAPLRHSLCRRHISFSCDAPLPHCVAWRAWITFSFLHAAADNPKSRAKVAA